MNASALFYPEFRVQRSHKAMINGADLLNNESIKDVLRAAWRESNPGLTGGHEEGGFVCVAENGKLTIDRWPYGQRNEIFAPPHPDGRRNGEIVIATFHTHPNTGNTFFQEPSPGDCEAVQNDPDLKHPEYVGEFVVSQDTMYLIFSDGRFAPIGRTPDLLADSGAEHDQ